MNAETKTKTEIQYFNAVVHLENALDQIKEADRCLTKVCEYPAQNPVKAIATMLEHVAHFIDTRRRERFHD